MHFLHKTFRGTIDRISHCAKFHSSSCLIPDCQKSGLVVLITENQLGLVFIWPVNTWKTKKRKYKADIFFQQLTFILNHKKVLFVLNELGIFLQPLTSISNCLQMSVCKKETDQCGHKLFSSSIIPQDQHGQVEFFPDCKCNKERVFNSTSGYCKGIMFKQCLTKGIYTNWIQMKIQVYINICFI